MDVFLFFFAIVCVRVHVCVCLCECVYTVIMHGIPHFNANSVNQEGVTGVTYCIFPFFFQFSSPNN